MSQFAAEIINAVPGIKNLRYLELGVGDGWTYNKVEARIKVGVDINSSGLPGVLKVSTDDFFAVTETLFDIVFIDADHEYGQALRDYNNSCSASLILIHDLFPPSEDYAVPFYCGDSYKLLAALIEAGQEVVVLDTDFGLSVVFRPQPISPDRSLQSLTYEEFLLLGYVPITLEEMKRRVSAYLS